MRYNTRCTIRDITPIHAVAHHTQVQIQERLCYGVHRRIADVRRPGYCSSGIVDGGIADTYIALSKDIPMVLQISAFDARRIGKVADLPLREKIRTELQQAVGMNHVPIVDLAITQNAVRIEHAGRLVGNEQ